MPLKDICDKISSSEDVELCMATIQSAAANSAVHDTSNMDVSVALTLSINGNIAYANTAVQRIKELLRDTTRVNNETRECLTTCDEMYSDSIEDLEQVKKEIKEKTTTSDIVALLDGVVNEYTSCQDEFNEASLASVISEYQEQLESMANINLALAQIIWPKSS
ncbi:uncharacterized protein A4U43_C07F14440 [Asparagus officinalis]|uniref:Pectinesterase inhibitor domain-containing protein n=1 Tax=Asparagus officinalis TaxID=4686 RepID=A0A5P1EF91_ASPOF|nr:uncharacterized protein A4U43_C07F14440 [Asparagus officinalis]